MDIRNITKAMRERKDTSPTLIAWADQLDAAAAANARDAMRWQAVAARFDNAKTHASEHILYGLDLPIIEAERSFADIIDDTLAPVGRPVDATSVEPLLWTSTGILESINHKRQPMSVTCATTKRDHFTVPLFAHAPPAVSGDMVLVARKDAEAVARFAFNNAGRGLRAPVASAGERILDTLRSPPASVPDGLIDRIKAAEQRIHDNHAPRRIPADPTDVDLVLAEVRMFLETGERPFWITPTTPEPRT